MEHVEVGENRLLPGHMYHRRVIDIRTGMEVVGLRKTFEYRGRKAEAVNVRLKPPIPSFDQLSGIVTPIAPGQPEGIAWTWYDTATYTSGTTTTLDFFQTVQTDKVLGNMQAAGQLPNPMFFMLYHLGIHFDLGPSGLAVAAAIGTPILGALNDVNNLLEGRMRLEIAQKTYHETKVSLCPWGGGAFGNVAIAGTYTATDGDQVQQGTNGFPDIRNRNCFWGTITIPPTQNFIVSLFWTAAVTLNNGNTAIVCALDGYLFRRVL